MTKLSLRLGLPLAILCGFAGLALAAASPVVYHSPVGMNGVNPGTPHVLDEPTEMLELYYSPGPMGTTLGETCLDGNGDEICGITIEIQSTGDVMFQSFNEDLSNDLVVNFSPPTNSLKINRINGTTGDPAAMGVRLGSLQVSVGASGGDISVSTTSEAVGASLQDLNVEDNGTIATPEPGMAISVALGVLAICLATYGRRALA